MRDSYYLPWDRKIHEDGLIEPEDVTGKQAIDYLATRVAAETSHTKAEAAEAIYRLLGWLCK